jgi:hypothetical protein
MAQINWTSQALQDLGLIAEFIDRDAPSFVALLSIVCKWYNRDTENERRVWTST